MSFKVIIPARYSSGRLPGKPLLDLNGKSMIQRVFEQACQSSAERIIIATDDERICSTATRFGAEAVMTQGHHPTGTDRIQEVTSSVSGFAADDIVVNVQGDEPFVPPAVIDQVAQVLARAPGSVAAATLCCPLARVDDIFNPSVVKVVPDKHGRAIFFSRAPVPWDREAFAENRRAHMPVDWVYQRHIGIYAYRVHHLNAFVARGECPLESTEQLEQLRFMWHGDTVMVEPAGQLTPADINTPEDLHAARERLRALTEESSGERVTTSGDDIH